MTEIITYNSDRIGGNVVVIKTEKSKIAIDFGENLPGSGGKTVDIEGLSSGKAAFDGVFFTHYHGDHIGRMKYILPDVKIYLGELAREVLFNISTTIHEDDIKAILEDNDRITELHENTPVKINGGDITVTPYTVDHSAYEAFMFLIETPDKVILHTGDFRGHGYRGKALLPVIEKYIRQGGKRNVDILITEGTMMSRTDEKPFTEYELQMWAEDFFREHKYVFLICSSTNLDSLASFCQAGQKNGMQMFCNGYVCKQLETFTKTAGEKSSLYKFKNVYTVNFSKELPPAKFNGTQEEFMRRYGFICIINANEKYEKWIERFKDCDPVLIYSEWAGYLDSGRAAYNRELAEFCKKYNAVCKHTSGHADAEVIEKVIEAVDPTEALIPIHCEEKDRYKFKDLSDKCVFLSDGEVYKGK